MGYLGVLILLVLFGLLTGGGLKPDLALNDLAQAGAQVFRIVAYGQVILVCLLAPLFMAATISSEQQGETYDILMTTPLSSLQIVLGSLMGRLFFVLALLLSGLPLFSILLLFGGVPITSVWSAMTVAAMTALFMGAVAVTLSVLRAGGRKAVFGFVIAVAGYLMAAYLPGRDRAASADAYGGHQHLADAAAPAAGFGSHGRPGQLPPADAPANWSACQAWPSGTWPTRWRRTRC